MSDNIMFTWRWRSSMWRQFVTSQTCVSGSQCLITSCLPGGGVHQCGDSLSPLRPASQDLNVRVHHIYLEVAFINVAAVCRLSDPRLRISMSEYIVFTWRWRSSMWRQFVASRPASQDLKYFILVPHHYLLQILNDHRTLKRIISWISQNGPEAKHIDQSTTSQAMDMYISS